METGFCGLQYTPTPSNSSALSELFVFVEFKGCSANPREPGWRSIFHKPDLSSFAGCPSGALSLAPFTLERGGKQQEAGSSSHGVLRGRCQELPLLHRLAGTESDPHLGARCVHTRTCATADPSVAQDAGLAFAHGKEIDSLQSTG